MIALGDLPEGNRRHPVLCGVALGFTLAALAAGTGCENTGDDDAFDQSDGSLQGELAMYTADDHDRGTSSTYYAIRSATGLERRPRIRSAIPGLQPGARIRVWGFPSAAGIKQMRVTSLKQLAPRSRTRPSRPS